MLQVSPELLGARLIDSRGNKSTIMACWLEKPADKANKPQFIALIKKDDGACFKQYLPDPDIWFLDVPYDGLQQAFAKRRADEDSRSE